MCLDRSTNTLITLCTHTYTLYTQLAFSTKRPACHLSAGRTVQRIAVILFERLAKNFYLHTRLAAVDDIQQLQLRPTFSYTTSFCRRAISYNQHYQQLSFQFSLLFSLITALGPILLEVRHLKKLQICKYYFETIAYYQ